MTQPWRLCLWRVDAGTGGNPQREIANVADDGDDFDVARRIAVDRDPSPDGILQTEVGAREGFVDGNHGGCAVSVSSIEAAPGEHRYAKRSEVIDADHAELSKRSAGVLGLRYLKPDGCAEPADW